MCILSDAPPADTPTPHTPAARLLPPQQRQHLALQALAGTRPLAHLAADHDVSRKFVYQLAAQAEHALDAAFAPPDPDADRVLFHLPVTQAWLQQLTLGLVLICHSSYRGVVELLRDLFDYPLALGTVHNFVHRTVARARAHNAGYDLAAVRIGALDEIFQAGRPVLVGADVDSTYCYLLTMEERRDADTWGVRLLELADRGFDPDATVADAGTGLRAGQALALPGTPCRGDVFHLLQALTPVVTYLENQAYKAIATRTRLQERQAQSEQRQGRKDLKVAAQLRVARPAEARAIALADDVALLVRWLREDLLRVAGPAYAQRCALYDFVVAELRARAPQCAHRLRPVCTLLANQRDDVLAFARALEQDLAAVAERFGVRVELVRALLNVQALAAAEGRRGPLEASLRRQLGGCFVALSAAVGELPRRAVRASSVIENLNSRLRNYFFLRRQLGPDSLALLQFFLNHRRFLRSERPERAAKSPAELLTGQGHAHWLELLGFQRFSRN